MRHWLDEQTLLFEIPWDLEDGPLDQVLELNWPGREAEVLAERLEVALQANQEAVSGQLAVSGFVGPGGMHIGINKHV